MKHLIRTMTLLASFVLSGSAGAGDSPSSPPVTPVGAQIDDPKDWSHTRLYPERTLRDQIQRTKAFLDDKESEVDDEIDRLKTEGLLDRRSTSKIRTALDDARGSMSGMAEEMHAGIQVDGWTARMIAYELGMAADTLAHHAGQIETNLSEPPPESRDEPKDGRSVDLDQRLQLAETLKTASTLLRQTARAIVRSLR